MSSAIGAAGELFAIRRELFLPVEPDTILDDFVISMRLVEKGFRISYLPEAYATETASLNLHEEYKRKVRIAAGGIQVLARLSGLLNPFRFGWLSWQFRITSYNVCYTKLLRKRTDESLLRNAYRMMNLSQLEHSEDSLYLDYNYRVRRFALGMRYNHGLDQSVADLSEPIDSLRDYSPDLADTAIAFADVYNRLDPLQKSEVVASALNLARRNKQTIDQNVFELYNLKKNVNKYSMEKHRKFTWSVACLIFFFIGAPLGAIIRKGGLGMPVVVSILMFITYYMVSISGEKFAREDLWDMSSGMWFSTLIFLPVGFFLTYKAANDSGLLNIETYEHNIKRFFLYLKNKLGKVSYEDSSADK